MPKCVKIDSLCVCKFSPCEDYQAKIDKLEERLAIQKIEFEEQLEFARIAALAIRDIAEGHNYGAIIVGVTDLLNILGIKGVSK